MKRKFNKLKKKKLENTWNPKEKEREGEHMEKIRGR